MADDELVALRAERDLLKAVALRQVQYRKTQVARLTRERDEALAALNAVKAEAWDEGYETGEGDLAFEFRGLSTDPDASEFPHKNPYRKETTG